MVPVLQRNANGFDIPANTAKQEIYFNSLVYLLRMCLEHVLGGAIIFDAQQQRLVTALAEKQQKNPTIRNVSH